MRKPNPDKSLNEKCHLISEILRKRIRNGELPPGSKFPHQSDLSRELGTSEFTLRLALKHLVCEGLITRERGRGTFVTDPDNKPLFPGRKMRIGVLMSYPFTPETFGFPFLDAVIQGLLRFFHLDSQEADWTYADKFQPTRAVWEDMRQGITLECIGPARKSPSRRPELETVLESRFDGVLILNIFDEAWMGQILDSGLETVVLDYRSDCLDGRADQVYVDSYMGVSSAMRHYIREGLQRIFFAGLIIRDDSARKTPGAGSRQSEAFPPGFKIEPDCHNYLSALRQTLDQHGMAVPESSIRYSRTGTPNSYHLAMELLALPEEQRPDGILCHGIDQAHTIIETFQEHQATIRAVGISSKDYRGPADQIRVDGCDLGACGAERLRHRLLDGSQRHLNVSVPTFFQSRNLHDAMRADARPLITA